jgi:hypothetical protein
MKFSFMMANQPELSVTSTRKIKTMDKRFELLYAQIDWDLQKRKPYVVADPCDPDQLLYLVEKDYLLTMRASLRNGDSLIVVARPGSTQQKGDSK